MNGYKSRVENSSDAAADCLVQISFKLFHTFLGFVLNFLNYLKSLKKYLGCCYGFFLGRSSLSSSCIVTVLSASLHSCVSSSSTGQQGDQTSPS